MAGTTDGVAVIGVCALCRQTGAPVLMHGGCHTDLLTVDGADDHAGDRWAQQHKDDTGCEAAEVFTVAVRPARVSTSGA